MRRTSSSVSILEHEVQAYRRLGVLGGTFDPVHIGHLRCALDVKEFLELDRVMLVPSKTPPHKPESYASASDRYKMLKLAALFAKELTVSDFELGQSRPSYTFYTLQHFGTNAQKLFFIIGSDAFSEIRTWHRWEEIFNITNFAVMLRAGHEPEDIGKMLPSEITADFERQEVGYRHRSGNMIIPVKVTKLDVSSTQVRRLVALGKSIRFLVPERVMEYIEKKRLYRPT